MSLDRFHSDVPVFGFTPKVQAAGAADLVAALSGQAELAAAFLKALSHEGRLMILCHLAEGEKSVSELEGLLGHRQAAVSQQLARLRLEGLVATRREGKAIFYSVRDARVTALLSYLPNLFPNAA